jgi:hypothetical protein
MNDLEKFKISLEEVMTDVVEIAKKMQQKKWSLNM